MLKRFSGALLLAAFFVCSAWAQGQPVTEEDDGGMIPGRLLTRTPIVGRIECDHAWNCSATDGVYNDIFWRVDMRAIPHELVAYISDNCNYDRSLGCSARYLIYPEFPLLKIVTVTLETNQTRKGHVASVNGGHDTKTGPNR